MKITGTKTQIVELPADEPLAGAAANPNGKRPIVTLLVQTDAGDWWMVLLGIRPLARQHYIGRETLLAPVSWNAQGWPVVNQGRPLSETMSAAGLPPSHPWPPEPVRFVVSHGVRAYLRLEDRFSERRMPVWSAPRTVERLA